MNYFQSSHTSLRSSESAEQRSHERLHAESRSRTSALGRSSDSSRDERGRRRENSSYAASQVSDEFEPSLEARGRRGTRDENARNTRGARGVRPSWDPQASRAASDASSERGTRGTRYVRPAAESRERIRTAEQTRRRSVGATAISASGARAIGLSRRDMERPHGRGETARRVESSRNESVYARPAVYTAEAREEGLASRIRLPKLALPLSDVSRFRWSGLVTPLMVIAIIALVIAMISGPASTYYHAWRDAGRSKAEYEVLMEQNAELNHEVERLQTLEGIEDEARSRGYVYPDEEALVVKGLTEDTVSDSERVQAALEAYEENLPWYVGCLDTLFGYTHDKE